MKALMIQGGIWGAAITIAALAWSWLVGLIGAPGLGLPAVVVVAPGDAVARLFIADAHGNVLLPFWIGTNLLAGIVVGGLIGFLRRMGWTTQRTEPANSAYRR